jgi:hypothetical protein
MTEPGAEIMNAGGGASKTGDPWGIGEEALMADLAGGERVLEGGKGVVARVAMLSTDSLACDMPTGAPKFKLARALELLVTWAGACCCCCWGWVCCAVLGVIVALLALLALLTLEAAALGTYPSLSPTGAEAELDIWGGGGCKSGALLGGGAVAMYI